MSRHEEKKMGVFLEKGKGVSENRIYPFNLEKITFLHGKKEKENSIFIEDIIIYMDDPKNTS